MFDLENVPYALLALVNENLQNPLIALLLCFGSYSWWIWIPCSQGTYTPFSFFQMSLDIQYILLLLVVQLIFLIVWNFYQLLSHFSRVRLCATPWTVTCQAPLSMRFSKQEYWSRLSFASPGGASWPRDQTQISCLGRCILYHWATREVICFKGLRLYNVFPLITMEWNKKLKVKKNANL